MVHWYHLICTAYGFWLPNDPRGSWSDFVASWELYKFGPATTTTERRSLAHDPHDVAQRRAAKRVLKYPAVRFDPVQRTHIALGFGQALNEAGYVVHACCVGHDHAHLVIARHHRPIERIAQHLKSRATMTLTRGKAHPLKQCRTKSGKVPMPWSEYNWYVYIDNEEHFRAAIEYVERHPMKEGLAPQGWSFVRPVEG